MGIKLDRKEIQEVDNKDKNVEEIRVEDVKEQTNKKTKEISNEYKRVNKSKFFSDKKKKELIIQELVNFY